VGDSEACAGAENLRPFVASQGGSVAPLCELRRDEDSPENRSLGPVTGLIGRSCGGPLRDRAVQTAFDLAVSRVWPHTRTDDHANALHNSLKFGYSIFKVEDENADEKQ